MKSAFASFYARNRRALLALVLFKFKSMMSATFDKSKVHKDYAPTSPTCSIALGGVWVADKLLYGTMDTLR